MPHIHDLYDFVVTFYIVYRNKVLLVHHRLLKKWVPLGGHIELDEDPDEALVREIKEECGLRVQFPKRRKAMKGTKPLYLPDFLDTHYFSKKHRHISLIYFLKAKNDKVKLAEREHFDIRWFSKEDLRKREYNLEGSVRFYSRQALEKFRRQ